MRTLEIEPTHRIGPRRFELRLNGLKARHANHYIIALGGVCVYKGLHTGPQEGKSGLEPLTIRSGIENSTTELHPRWQRNRVKLPPPDVCPACFRYTTLPYKRLTELNGQSAEVDPRGVEPLFPPCREGVLPLYDGPVSAT